ncbi:lymphatic vessel endothelial hyaluronic acid receptor 1 [Gracilinanus agilis]|uniref:lymphatic vessel endothelial hyaluronic acid receptor 1 n=1 Tax=Gracilinanus agilis TaxID=191870 RepID=UPI001CFDC4E8|nr:lymphatic vessel endothelial hyaluronic acid receptor 1 [Gracilinanus agilis]
MARCPIMERCPAMALLLSLLLFMVQGLLRVEDLLITEQCRIMGITLIGKGKGAELNFTDASDACSVLGLQLASKTQVTIARDFGFETCSFGWVSDKYVVISRILPNPKCGQNKIGVLEWKVPLYKKQYAYCYNSSDIWLNSCFPDAVTTEEDITIPPTVLDTTETGHNVSDTADTTTTSPAPPPNPVKPRWNKKLICVTELFLETSTVETSTMPEDVEPTFESQAAFKNDGVTFGGVPTTLLVLALIFFIAAVVLAVCYVKRYMSSFPFTNKNQKEITEAKGAKATKAGDKTPKEEPKKSEKKAEETKMTPKMTPKMTVKYMEAEV